MSILNQIAAHAKERVAKDKERISTDEIRALARSGGPADGIAFYNALAKPGMRFICEVKKASPSKGLIDPVFHYPEIAASYENAGADCISCLTEPNWFLGSDAIFREIRALVRTPMLRKDFIVDEYQIYQTKLMGANCILLICALLPTDTLARYLQIASDLGLAVLTEAHDADEIASAVSAGANIIGVNNRNLKDFSVDFSNASRLRDLIPAECLYVAESGVQTPEDVAALHAAGADAVLIGEALMRADNKGELLTAMREKCRQDT